MPLRPCINTTCPNLTAGTRCNPCQQEHDRDRNRRRTHYHGTYQLRAAKLRATADANPATVCWICREPRKPGDPWTADHLTPGDPTSDLAIAHRSCNSRRGNNSPGTPAA